MNKQRRKRVTANTRQKYGHSIRPVLNVVKGTYKYGMTPFMRGARLILSPSTKAVRDVVVKPIARGAVLSARGTHRVATKPLVTGIVRTIDMANKYPYIANKVIPVGMVGLGGLGYYHGRQASSSEGIAGMANVAGDVYNIAAPQLLAMGEAGKEAVMAAYNRDIGRAGMGMGKFALRSAALLPSMMWSGGHLAYDMGHALGSGESTMRNITSPMAWIKLPVDAAMNVRYNTTRQRWTG